MNSKPILFSGEMVRAILADRKTQTRRIIKPQLEMAVMGGKSFEAFRMCTGDSNPMGLSYKGTRYDPWPSCFIKLESPYGEMGDILWVRETFYAKGSWLRRFNPKKERTEWYFNDMGEYHYIDNPPAIIEPKRVYDKIGYYKRPSLFMPKEAARLFLRITYIRVERLQDISEEDAKAEGVFKYASGVYKFYMNTEPIKVCPGTDTARSSFSSLWCMINGQESWKENPWVWVVSFERVDKPEEWPKYLKKLAILPVIGIGNMIQPGVSTPGLC